MMHGILIRNISDSISTPYSNFNMALSCSLDVTSSSICKQWHINLINQDEEFVVQL